MQETHFFFLGAAQVGGPAAWQVQANRNPHFSPEQCPVGKRLGPYRRWALRAGGCSLRQLARERVLQKKRGTGGAEKLRHRRSLLAA